MYFQLSFRKACGYGHFFTFDTKGEKVLIPRLLFLYFMINIHILFPLLYTRQLKKHTIFPHAISRIAQSDAAEISFSFCTF